MTSEKIEALQVVFTARTINQKNKIKEFLESYPEKIQEYSLIKKLKVDSNGQKKK